MKEPDNVPGWLEESRLRRCCCRPQPAGTLSGTASSRGGGGTHRPKPPDAVFEAVLERRGRSRRTWPRVIGRVRLEPRDSAVSPPAAFSDPYREPP